MHISLRFVHEEGRFFFKISRSHLQTLILFAKHVNLGLLSSELAIASKCFIRHGPIFLYPASEHVQDCDSCRNLLGVMPKLRAASAI